MTKSSHFALVFPLITSVGSVVNCGEKFCKNYEYCVDEAFCKKCEDICEPISHNYDEGTCRNKCADYTFDSMYIRRTDFDGAVKEIYTYVAISLVVSVLVLLIVLSSLTALWLKYRRIRFFLNNNNKKFKKKMESIAVVCANNEVDNSKKFKLELPAAKDTPPSALTTMTPVSRRHPSEDTTLEYAYDNPTLTPSPVFTKNEPINTLNMSARTETSF